MGEFLHSDAAAVEMRRNACLSGPARCVLAGVVLQPCNPEHHLRSALVVAIALTLAVGPNASLLCRIVCNPQAAAASGCHHQAPTTSSSMAAA